MGISQQIGASSQVKWGVCTSSTRPASPYHGQHIYETDTNLQYVWNGSAWVNNYASSASPTFTGTPVAPTAVFYTNSTQLATTAFVNTAIDNVSDGYRNIFINGGFVVDQRGMATSHTVTAGAALSYTVDRWYEYCTGANVTAARVTYSPVLGAAQNPYYYYRFTGATSNTLVGFGQRIETANVLGVSGSYCTVSARMVVGSGTKTVTWTAYYANTTDTFGTIASPTRTSIATGTFAVTTTETDFSAYFQIPSSVTGVEIVFTCPTLTSGQTISFGNMQLEKGLRLVPTPFQQRPIGVELALCQRYFWSLTTSGQGQIMGAQVSAYGNACYLNISSLNPVPMRVPPTPQSHPSYPIASYSPFVTDFNSNLRAISAINLSSPYMIQFVYNSTQLTANSSLGLNFADANRTLWLSAEL